MDTLCTLLAPVFADVSRFGVWIALLLPSEGVVGSNVPQVIQPDLGASGLYDQNAVLAKLPSL